MIGYVLSLSEVAQKLEDLTSQLEEVSSNLAELKERLPGGFESWGTKGTCTLIKMARTRIRDSEALLRRLHQRALRSHA